MRNKYFNNKAEFENYKSKIKLFCCPNPKCNKIGNFTLHGRLLNVDGENIGHRIKCDNRYRKDGCGKTYIVYFSNVIKNHTIKSDELWKFLNYLLKGWSISKSFKLIKKYTIMTAYHLINKFKKHQIIIRSNLIKIRPPPLISTSNPVLKTILHLKIVFKNETSPIQAYQTYFQKGIFEMN